MQKNTANMPFKPDPCFDPETETFEAIGPFFFVQKRRGNRYTRDSILLVDFIIDGLNGASKVIDLGAGAGIVPLLIAAKTPAGEITGVEVMDDYAAIAQRNVRLNGLESRVKILRGDFRDLPARYPEGSFSAVVSNPPYVKAGAGRQSPDPARRVGRGEVMGGLKDLLAVARHLAGGGSMFFVFPVSRLEEMLAEMETLSIEPSRLCYDDAANGKEGRETRRAKVFLIEAAWRKEKRDPGAPGAKPLPSPSPVL